MGNAFLSKRGTEAFKAARNKLFASNERQIDNQFTLVLDMLHSYMSVVCKYHCRGENYSFGVVVVLC